MEEDYRNEVFITIYHQPILEEKNTDESKPLDLTIDGISEFCEEELDEEDKSRSEATIRLVVNNVSRIKGMVNSSSFFVRNLQWRLSARIKHDHFLNKQFSKGLSCFLQCGGDSISDSWCCNTFAEMRLLNQKFQKDNFSKKIHYEFNDKMNHFDFNNFVSLNDLLDRNRGFIKNDSITLELWLKADAPHGINWDSKKHAGYVGLRNQGATCYMNSLLQAFFFTNQLRKAVYQIPTQVDEATTNVALALQRVFYELQFSDQPVGTRKLTKSFGWDTKESYMQHDVQELCRVLLDNIENKMMGTCVEGIIPELFEGTMVSFFRCKNVNYNSTRIEQYYDIQLNIKNKKNIYESFEDFCEKETLEGENRYDAGEFGFQDAEKGIIFKSFPPVLHLHLLRFQYDPNSGTNTKINEKFEFPAHLHLDKFLQYPESIPASYTLQSVLVHRGDNQSGHYVVFIHIKGEHDDDFNWFKFDDDVVSRCSKQDAIDFNFGGNIDDSSRKNCTNAYMLVYIRDSAIEQVLQIVRDDDIPGDLRARFREEKRVEVMKENEKNEAHLYMKLLVLTEDSFFGHQGYGLFNFKDAVNTLLFRIRKTLKVKELQKFLSEEMGYPVPMLRIWPIILRNRMFQPRALEDSDFNEDVYSLKACTNVWTIYLEQLPPDSELTALPNFDRESEILLFFKLFSPRQKRLFFCGHAYIQKYSTPNELIPFLNERGGFHPSTQLFLYQEVNSTLVEKIKNMSAPLEQALRHIINGDIIVFQKADSHMEEYEFSSPVEYFKNLLFKVEVIFCDIANANGMGCIVELSLKMNYDQMIRKVGQVLNVDPYFVQFFKTQPERDFPEMPSEFAKGDAMGHVLKALRMKPSRKIYYTVLPIRVDALESKKQFKFLWVSGDLKDEKVMIVYPDKSGTVSDLLDEVSKQVGLPQESSRNLRFLDVTGKRIKCIFEVNTPLEIIPNNIKHYYRVEEIPLDEMDLAADEHLLPVAHFYKNVSSTYGYPFIIKVKDAEPFKNIKERIRDKLAISDNDFKTYMFAIVTHRPKYIDSDDYLMCMSEFAPHGVYLSWLGLDHSNESPKMCQKNDGMERALKIHN